LQPGGASPANPTPYGASGFDVVRCCHHPTADAIQGILHSSGHSRLFALFAVKNFKVFRILNFAVGAQGQSRDRPTTDNGQHLPMRLLIHFARFGPYHHARLRAAHEVLGPLGWEVIGLETAGTDATYAWDATKGAADGARVVTAFPGRVYEEITAAEYRATLLPLLGSLKPNAMAIAGWGSTDARICLDWCRKHGVRRFVMSETRAADGKRVWWKELVKRYLISRFDGALVGGKSHRDYLVSLGMKPERIAFGYNVVDNGYFSEKTQDYKTQDTRRKERGQRSEGGGEERELSVVGCQLSEGKGEGDRGQGTSNIEHRTLTIERTGEDGGRRAGPAPSTKHAAEPQNQAQSTRHQARGVAAPFFLASNRFIERKNLARLIEAYAEYVKRCPSTVVRGRNEEVRKEESGVGGQAPGLVSCLPGIAGQAATGVFERSDLVSPWHLVLLGDGELKPALIAQCQRLGLTVIESAPWEVPGHTPEQGTSNIEHRTSNFDKEQSTKHEEPSTAAQSLPSTKHKAQSTKHAPQARGTVFFPGFRQIEELPRFYAHAGCFVHPALEEPWGLVLNEAMAVGLPVLSSNNVGAAEELVEDGVNGWKFDPEDAEQMASLMAKISAFNFTLSAFASASRRILEERCPTRAFGEGLLRLLE
jgi:glycosyltransferase involved in cell wall biosynthesis